MTIGERISRSMREKHISQREMASRVGITELTMSRYINDVRIPNAAVIGKIAKILGVTTDYLIGVDDLTNN